jgi:hypothetical protein
MSSLARLKGIESASDKPRQDFERRRDEIGDNQRSAEPGLQTVETHATVETGRDRQPDMAVHRVEMSDAGRETAIDTAIHTILFAAPRRWAFGDGPRRRWWPEGGIGHHNLQANMLVGNLVAMIGVVKEFNARR